MKIKCKENKVEKEKKTFKNCGVLSKGVTFTWLEYQMEKKWGKRNIWSNNGNEFSKIIHQTTDIGNSGKTKKDKHQEKYR